MNKQQTEQLLRSILAATQVPGDSVDIERARTQLDEYVRLEQVGEPAAQLLPEVAYFISSDSEFAALYRSLSAAHEQLAEYIERELAGEPVAQVLPEVAGFLRTRPTFREFYEELQALAEYRNVEERPNVRLDLERARTVLGLSIELASEDVVRPLVPPAPASPDYGRVLALVPLWERGLRRYSRTFMSGDAQDEFTFPVLAQSVAADVEVVLSESDELLAIDGRVRPAGSPLAGQLMRLYRVELEGEPTVTLAAEQPVDRLSRFAFTDLAAGHYALVVEINEELVGVGWLDLV